MKLATISTITGPRLSAVTADNQGLFDLQSAWTAKSGKNDPVLDSMLALIEAGERGMDVARKAFAWAQTG